MLRGVLVGAAVISLVVAMASNRFGATGGAVAAPGSPPTQCTPEQGQLFIDGGQYSKAVREFTCLIEADPTAVEGYRGRIEALLLLGQYSDAFQDHNRITAFVLPVHPDAQQVILAGYAERLSSAPEDIPALTGASFANWYYFAYPAAIGLLNDLLAVEPEDPYGNLFRGSSRLLLGANQAQGEADLERAIELDPASPAVRAIVADAYTYGQSDSERAFAEAMLALQWGLDTPRVHAILASAYLAFGDEINAAIHTERHIDLVTTELVTESPLMVKMSLTLAVEPGRTYEIPVHVTGGETLSIWTNSQDYFDTILVLLAPDGSAIASSDDFRNYFAGLDWVAPETGLYQLRVTFFESITTGDLVVRRN